MVPETKGKYAGQQPYSSFFGGMFFMLNRGL